MVALWILRWTRRPRVRERDRHPARESRVAAMRRTVGRTVRNEKHIDQAWTFLAVVVSALLLYLGAGYAINGSAVTSNTGGWRVLDSVLPGGVRTHGVILAVLGFALAVEIHDSYTRITLWTLRALRTYCMFVAACWLGSWFTNGISWGGPGWWIFLAAITVWLSRFAPVRAGV